MFIALDEGDIPVMFDADYDELIRRLKAIEDADWFPFWDKNQSNPPATYRSHEARVHYKRLDKFHNDHRLYYRVKAVCAGKLIPFPYKKDWDNNWISKSMYIYEVK